MTPAVTAVQLHQLCPRLGFAELAVFATHLNAALVEFGVDRPERVVAFLGQTLHESEGYSRLQESFAYRPERLLAVFPKRVRDLADAQRLVAAGQQAIAERVYGGRMGNGPEGSGDGWRYRARGVIGLTGRDNYAAEGEALGLRLLLFPDRAQDPDVMFRVAGRFWRERGLNALADLHSQSGFKAITRAINGGTNGLGDRVLRWRRACEVLGVPAPAEA